MDERSLINNKFLSKEVSNVQNNPEEYLSMQAEFRQFMQMKNRNLGRINFETKKQRINKVVEESENIIDYVDTKRPLINGKVMQGHISKHDLLSNNLINYDMDPYLLAAIKQQQEKPKERFVQDRKMTVAIDSRERVITQYLYQNFYKINLRHVFTNIVSVKMRDTIFINTQQLIKETPVSQKNNIIQWNIEEDGSNPDYIVYTTTLTPGNYTETTLAIEIENKMNSVVRSSGQYNNFTVSIDTVTDIVSFTSVEFSTISNPFSFTVPGPSIPYTEVTVTYLNHGFTNVGTRIYVENTSFTASGGLTSALFNTSHIIIEVIDTSSFKIRIPAIATSNVTNDGGTTVKIGSGVMFQLLWSESNSPATILGFSNEDTGFSVEHQNTKEIFKYGKDGDDETTRRIKINYMSAGDYNEITSIRTELPHTLTTGDRIYLYDNADEVPSGSGILHYEHLYGLDEFIDLTYDQNNQRKKFIAQISDPSGLIVTVIDDNTFTVPVEYETITKIEDKILLVDDDDTFGNIIIKDKNLAIDLSGEKYIFMCSPQLGGGMISTGGKVDNVFAKIQLAGTADSTIYNAFSGGVKYFNDVPLDFLDEIEISFRTQNGELFEFNDKNHSYVLEITEAVQKLEGSGLSARIGART